MSLGVYTFLLPAPASSAYFVTYQSGAAPRIWNGFFLQVKIFIRVFFPPDAAAFEFGPNFVPFSDLCEHPKGCGKNEPRNFAAL